MFFDVDDSRQGVGSNTARYQVFFTVARSILRSY